MDAAGSPAAGHAASGGAAAGGGPSRVVLVTGASTGIGRATAAEFARLGHRVIGTCRDPGALAPADRLPGVRYQPLDLGDRASVAACAQSVGPVDILVNNAGQSLMGPLEEVEIDVVERLFAVNVFGAVQLTQLLLPAMRAAGSGSVVMVGSLIAEFPLPFRSTYAASKLALSGFVLSARRELAPFGVRLSLVEPGYVQTALTGNRPLRARPDSPYAGPFAAVRAAIARGDARAGDPEPVARGIVTVALAEDPAPVQVLGRAAPALVAARRLMSRRFAERVVARAYGLGWTARAR
jgi:NAD(P)-dependent dehydrogenase (short-subunit alcohol dehydrogenase family)